MAVRPYDSTVEDTVGEVLEPEDADLIVALGLGPAGVDGCVIGAPACPQPTSRRHSAAVVTGR